ncbi:hypothetical protein [Dyella sp. Tek66A03]|uniref:hypothetical protein n=1 Tax=Dyella sp. Tek66A03 TaxID=3458298 RepID=UPI00403E573A
MKSQKLEQSVIAFRCAIPTLQSLADTENRYMGTHGEASRGERLVMAVETGIIPISMAVTISRSDDAGVHQALRRCPALPGVVMALIALAVQPMLLSMPETQSGRPGTFALTEAVIGHVTK